MSALNAILEPRPNGNVLAGDKPTPMDKRLADWFDLSLMPRVQQSAPITVRLARAAQIAALGATVLVGAANGGMYRITAWSRVVIADNVGSSLTVNLLCTDGGVICTQVGTALTANDVTKPLSQTFGVRADAGSVISFTTTYATTGGAPAMAYDVEFRVQPL